VNGDPRPNRYGPALQVSAGTDPEEGAATMTETTQAERAAGSIGADEIRRTYERISRYLRRTPTLTVPLAALTGAGHDDADSDVVLKLEQLQWAGSFKTRGAFANLLLREVPPAGVIAASGGNHGVAVAYAAHRLGVPATIFVPAISDPAKIEAIRSHGADLRVGGDRYADALAAAQIVAAESGAMPVHAFDQRETILGQGTLALELSEQVSELDTLLVPVGGGGLIAGTAAYFAGAVRVIGVEPDGAPTLTRARANGGPVDAPAGSIAADALAPRRVGDLVFPLAQSYVSDVLLVDDQAIRQAQHALWRSTRLIAEPAGAVTTAALITGAYRPAPGERVAVVITGANTTPSSFQTPVATEPS
jgi:threonine dehydratase